MTSDAELTAQVADGDLAAYGELYARHRRIACSQAGRFTRDPARRDDLVSEAFVRVLSAIGSGSRPVNFRAYLLAAVKSAGCAAARHNRRQQPADFGDDKAIAKALPTSADHADAAVDRLAARPARAAFATLPQRWREVLWASAVQGRSSAEIGKMFGLSPNAASALTHRAKKALREAILGGRDPKSGPRRPCRNSCR